jgi:cardiolipin synthase
MTQDETFQFYFEGDAYYDALWLNLAAAKREIWIEIYILAADEIGNRLANILIERARAGVQIKIICDGMGSYELPIQYIQRLRDGGVEVKIYHPIRLFNTRWNRRDHRKVVVIDDDTAFLGGFNFHRECSQTLMGECRWRDTQVRVTGRLVNKLLYFICKTLGEQKTKDAELMRFSFVNDIVTNQNRYGLNHIKRFYLRYIRRARTIIRISTAYFVPDLKLIYYLLRAKRRGVRIQVITSSQASDVPLIRRVNRIILRQLVLHGIEVYDFKSRMMHAKSAIFDDHIATVGSANLNHRSLFLDLEMNLFLRDPRHVRLLLEQHEHDLARCRPITMEELDRVSFLDRILDKIFYWLRGFF